MLRRQWIGFLAAGLLVAGLVGPTMAQDNAGGGNAPAAGGGGGGGGRNFDPAQWRQRMMDRMKEQLGANDEEWKALQPKVEKVMEAQREARSGGMMMMFGGDRGGRRGGDQARQPETAVAKAAADLRTTLDNKDATAEQISQKLAALRAAKEKAQANLTAAQKELRELLTQRQEAALVMAGILE